MASLLDSKALSPIFQFLFFKNPISFERRRSLFWQTIKHQGLMWMEGVNSEAAKSFV